LCCGGVGRNDCSAIGFEIHGFSGAGDASVVWATHANQSSSIAALYDRDDMVAATRELPASGYALEVDGRLKAEFATRDGARTGGEELKKRFPMLQIRIYDAETKTREEIQLR
jgi:hypothetical protein